MFLQFLSNVDLKTFKDKNVKILEAKIHRVYIEMLFECEVMDDGMRRSGIDSAWRNTEISLCSTPEIKTLTYFFIHGDHPFISFHSMDWRHGHGFKLFFWSYIKCIV